MMSAEKMQTLALYGRDEFVFDKINLLKIAFSFNCVGFEATHSVNDALLRVPLGWCQTNRGLVNWEGRYRYTYMYVPYTYGCDPKFKQILTAKIFAR